MAESTELELSNLQHKSTGWDNQGFEDLQSEEVELAKRDATTADSTGLGRLLFRGVTGAVDAVASLGAFGQKNGPKGATKIKEPQSHRQTTAEKRTGPQLHGETDLLDVAFQHSAELLQKNAELTKHLSNYETKKKQEINDLTAHLKELKRAVTVLNRDCEKKDKKIAEMKTLVQKLSDKKRDGSSELARALHEKDTQIEALAQLLQTEKVKLRVTCTEVKEKQKESEEYKKQTQELSNELKKYNRVDITFDKDIISDSGATHDTIHTPQDKEVQELNEAIQSEPTESPGESVALEKVDQLQEALREKEMQLANPENQLKEYEAKVLEMEQVRDHSKSQSKALLVVKQELDATKMSPDDLVQYIGSMERQVADTKTHCRKLEAQLNGAREDYDIAQQALRDTREGLEAELESVRETHSKLSTTNSSLEAQLFQAQEKIDNLSVEKEAFVQERAVLKQEIFDLHDKLAIATAEAELYKEDFESERKDREKAHDLREEMRCICDEKVHAMAKERHAFEECIQNLTRELQGLSNEKEGLLEIRAFTRQHKPQQNDKQIHELQEQLYVAHQKAITAQEEVQAKTAQVKQYKKKDDQREEKLISLDVRNQELVQEMERVRSELIKAKTESANLLKEEKKLNQNEMKKICLELERALKKTSKSKAHDELLKVELVNNSLRVDKERLSGSLQEVQEQFARLKLELKKEVTNTIPTTPPTYTESTIPIQPNQFCLQVSVKHDTPQARSSHPTAIPRPDPNNEHSIAQQPPTMPNVNIVPQATQDNYNPQPEARLVPNSPTEGRSSMNFDDPRPAYDRVEVNGFRNAAGQNERQSSTGPQPDNSIRYPPGLQVKQSHSSAPSSTNLALSEQAASPTDALNRMSLVLGDQQLERPSNIPSDFSQSQYPANTHQGGGYQDPVSNYQGQSGFDNLPQDQYQNQPRRESPSMHRHPSQWPNHDQFHQMEVTNTTTQPPIPIQNVGHSDGIIYANMETSAQVCEALEGGVADCHSLIKRLQDGLASFQTNREVFMKVTGERDRLSIETAGQREIIATIQHELKIKEKKSTSLAEETERVRVDLQLALNKCTKLLTSLKQCREESEQSIAEVRGRCEQETDRRIKQERQARRVFKQLDRRVKEPVVLSPSKET
ncbi:myosin-1-like isoform X4 [Halichondria panicea]|uniref:myosin-1-like isoform X4 n=1 Tax=Halichondria panicea TaxID=6063 RepID=UPI00312BB086